METVLYKNLVMLPRKNSHIYLKKKFFYQTEKQSYIC